MKREKEERINLLYGRIKDIEVELARLTPMQLKAESTIKRYKEELFELVDGNSEADKLLNIKTSVLLGEGKE